MPNTGESQEKDRLIAEYLPHAKRLAERYRRKSGVSEDLDQVASTALELAVDRFRPERGDSFPRVAAPIIIGQLRRYVRDKESAVPIRRPAGGASRSPVTLSGTAWRPEADLDLREWTEHGRRLGVITRGVGWWLGDWLRYGNERFGERYARAARITGYDVQTLMNMVYVASRFEISRRREALSFSHHAEVAAHGPDAQEYWLSHAEGERLSVRCLREELRRERRLLNTAAHSSVVPSSEAAVELVCPQCGCHFQGTHRDGGQRALAREAQ